MIKAAFFYKRVHPSWCIATISFGVLAGVAASLLVGSDFFANFGWLMLGIVLAVLVFIRPVQGVLLLAVCSGLLIGVWRGSIERVNLGGYGEFLGAAVSVQGVVAEDVPSREGGALEMRLKDVSIEGKAVPGQVWLTSSSDIEVKRSDIVTVEGQLKEGFGTFPATMYFADMVKVERPEGADIARDVRDTFTDAVRMGIPEPEASLGVGYLTGQRSTLPAELEDQLRIVGLTHVVVASGYNLTILVRFARRAFEKVSKYMAAASAGAMIICFMLVTGFSPSMSRAGLVAGLSLLAWYYGRTVHPMVLLPFTAGITLLVNPMYIWGDLGWYLSFLSFVGVILFSPLVHDYFWGAGKQPGVVRQTLVDTMSAQLITFPILAFSFGEYSPYALLANLLVLPLIPLTMVLTFVTGIVGLIIPQIVALVGVPADLILSYMTYIIRWVAELPGAQSELSFGVSAMIISYAVIFCVGFHMQQKTKHSFRQDSIVE